MNSNPFEWDADRYGALPLPHVRWGLGVIDRLHLAGNERVLDLGCGTGRDALVVLDTFPGCTLVGVDASSAMLASAAKTLASKAGRFALRQADLRTADLELEEPVDAAMSVAALHWIPDHEPVFTLVARLLRSGGRFVADAGGAGNIARFTAALDRVLPRFGISPDQTPWHFATPDQTARLLRDAGFSGVNARLRPDPVTLPADAYPTYVATVMLGKYLSQLTPDEGQQLVDDVVDAIGEPVIDYVRLEFEAVR